MTLHEIGIALLLAAPVLIGIVVAVVRQGSQSRYHRDYWALRPRGGMQQRNPDGLAGHIDSGGGDVG